MGMAYQAPGNPRTVNPGAGAQRPGMLPPNVTKGFGMPPPANRPIIGAPPKPFPNLPYGGPIAMPGGNMNGHLPSAPIGGQPIAYPGGNMNGQLPSFPVPGMPTAGMGGGKSNQNNMMQPQIGGSFGRDFGSPSDPGYNEARAQQGLPPIYDTSMGGGQPNVGMGFGPGQVFGPNGPVAGPGGNMPNPSQFIDYDANGQPYYPNAQPGSSLPPGVSKGFGFNPMTGGPLGQSMPQPLPSFGRALNRASPLFNTIQPAK